MMRYDVDWGKVRFRHVGVDADGRAYGPPEACPACFDLRALSRFARWRYELLMWWWYGADWRSHIHETLRCSGYDGHWHYPSQREHECAAFGKWPVSVHDIARLAPDEQEEAA